MRYGSATGTGDSRLQWRTVGETLQLTLGAFRLSGPRTFFEKYASAAESAGTLFGEVGSACTPPRAADPPPNGCHTKPRPVPPAGAFTLWAVLRSGNVRGNHRSAGAGANSRKREREGREPAPFLLPGTGRGTSRRLVEGSHASALAALAPLHRLRRSPSPFRGGYCRCRRGRWGGSPPPGRGQ